MSVSVPARGWYAEVTHPTSGHVWTPTILDAQRQPAANDYQRIRLTVPKDDHWQSLVDSFPDTDIALAVYYAGTQQPIEVLEDVEDTAGETILIGRGGVALDQRVTYDVDKERHDVIADDIISNQLPYDANVDTPTTTKIADDKTVQSPDSDSEWQSVTDLDADEPVVIQNGNLELARVTWFSEAENSNTNALITSNSKYSNGKAAEIIAAGEKAEFNFTPDHDVPASDTRIVFLGEVENFDGRIEYNLDGTTGPAFVGNGTTNEFFIERDPSTGLSANTQSNIKLNATNVSSGSFLCDMFWVYDNGDRFSVNFNINKPSIFGFSNQSAAAPEFFPDQYDVELDTTPVVAPITEATVETSGWNNTSEDQALGISFDGGASYNTADNSTSTTETVSFSLSVTPRITLSRYTSAASTTPTTGDSGQTVDSLSLKVDQEDLPVMADQLLDGTARDVLAQIAESGNFLWSYSRNGSPDAIEWTQPGQRTADDAPDIVDYSTTTSTEDVIQKAIVKGSSQRRRAEVFTSDHGTAVDLDKDLLQKGKATVYNPSTDTQFETPDDYVIDAENGKITTQSGGAMSDATTYEISYSWIPTGSFTEAGVGSPDETIQQVPAVTSARAAEQAAFRIVDQIKDPLVEATVTAPSSLGWSVVEAIDLAELPVDNALEIRTIENTPEETVFQLGSREGLAEFVDRFNRRLSSVADRT